MKHATSLQYKKNILFKNVKDQQYKDIYRDHFVCEENEFKIENTNYYIQQNDTVIH